MKTSKLLLAVLGLFILAATANTASAQVSNTVQATATVLDPLSVTGTNLTFGKTIISGTSKTVAPTDAGAATFDIAGTPGKEVTVDFGTLPSSLTHTDGTTTLPISFGTTDLAHNTTSDAGTATTVDPSATLTTTLEATTGELYLWLGGTVTAAAAQKAGDYSGDITMTVAYTGN